MNNALTNCCHFPAFADGICPNCGQVAQPFEPEHGPLVNERIDFFPVTEQPIHTVINPVIETPKIPRFDPNTDEEYDWHAQSEFVTNEEI